MYYLIRLYDLIFIYFYYFIYIFFKPQNIYNSNNNRSYGCGKEKEKKAMDIVTVFLNNNNLIRWDGYWGSRKNVQ